MWRERLRELVASVPPDDLDAAIGELEAGKARLYARLLANGRPSEEVVSDPYNLTAEVVAEELGLTPKWCYSHRRELGGKRIGGCVRFSRRGLQRYLAARR